MRKKGFFAMAFATVPALILAVLLVTGCDHSVASGDLHGRWLAWGGMSLEFSNGRFTRVMPGGEVQIGTYQTNGGYVTFHRREHTPETEPFSLEFPRLVVGDITFFHDSPAMPNDLEGFWDGFLSIHSTGWPRTLLLGPAEPQRGNPWIMEGVFEEMSFKGAYTVSLRNLPNSGVFTMRVTHVSGSALAAYIRYRLPVHLMELFDWELLLIPGLGEWWFTLDEARRFFVNAAGRTGGDLALEQQIINAMNSFLPRWIGETEFYDYTLEEVEGNIYDLFGAVVEGRYVFTMRTMAGGILTFVRVNW